jgi:hypothetical protein
MFSFGEAVTKVMQVTAYKRPAKAAGGPPMAYAPITAKKSALKKFGLPISANTRANKPTRGPAITKMRMLGST